MGGGSVRAERNIELNDVPSVDVTDKIRLEEKEKGKPKSTSQSCPSTGDRLRRSRKKIMDPNWLERKTRISDRTVSRGGGRPESSLKFRGR